RAGWDSRRRHSLGATRQRVADRLRVSLRLRHAHRGGHPDHLVSLHSTALRGGRDAMTGFPLLSVITFLPLVGALLLLVINGEPALVARNARWVALWTSLITLVLSIYLWVAFDRSSADFQFVERVEWMRDFGMLYQMGVDGISMPFVLLSAVLTP